MLETDLYWLAHDILGGPVLVYGQRSPILASNEGRTSWSPVRRADLGPWPFVLHRMVDCNWFHRLAGAHCGFQ